MTVEELKNLVQEVVLQKCERQDLELKEARGGTPKRLYDTLSSFANQIGGGTLLFGISEAEGFAITGVYDAQDLQVKVTEQCKQMSPTIRPLFTVAEINGRTVVSAEITETDIFDKPCFYLGAGRMRGSYVRVGDADITMTEYEVYSLEAFKRKIHDELRIVDRATVESFDNEEITRYFAILRKEKPNLANMTDEQLMRFQGIVENGKPTVGGVMLFGIYPQSFFPQLSITAMLVPGYEIAAAGSEERFIDNKRIDGTIPQMLDGAIGFVRRNMRTKTIIDDTTAERRDKTEYPIKAIREIILNSLIHRDYSIHTDGSPIRIVMYKDRIEVENPGGLYGRLTVDDLGKAAADTRNPFIAGMLEVMLKTENRFSGIPTILAEMNAAGLPRPVFESVRGVFKATLYNNEAKQELIEAHEVGEFETQILDFCKLPRSREELAKELHLESSLYYMMTRYIQPLIKQGKLRLVFPNVPKSKNQRYQSKS
ncbi:MAG: putative DNA binding domain-containing protein [Clostridiales bacterium]|jgi:ATP-dependent DNA helicase RecG|nr:putative DNA binding domain-containing protein [Clostridiales bacterium]